MHSFIDSKGRFLRRVKANLLQLRPFEAERDYEDFRVWYEDHGRGAPPEEFLPPIGVVVYRDYGDKVEKTGMLFLYLAQGVGVGFVEHLVVPPGLTTAQAREIAVVALDYLRPFAARDGLLDSRRAYRALHRPTHDA